MLSTREKQSVFAVNIARLILFVDSHPGWALTHGDFARMDKTGHSDNSLHYLRLAADLNFFLLIPNPKIEGGMMWKWIKTNHPYWHVIGDYWKSLDPLNRWGGDFSERDYNHFSMTEGGFQ